MYKFTPFIKYKKGNDVVESEKTQCEDYSIDIETKDNRIKCVFIPKTELELIKFELITFKNMGKDEVFFSNGYQSWSTCYEVHRDDKIKGMAGFINALPFARKLASISGDYDFTDYNKTGCFHSHTYTYFRKNNELEFLGSMSEKSGFTVFETDSKNCTLKIIKDVEGLKTSDRINLIDVICLKGGYDEVFDKYFAACNFRKPKINHLSGYTSWYNYFQNINEEIILRDLDGLDRVSDEVSIFQIDDGYESFVGDWLTVDNKKFPGGMKYIAEKIHGKGYLAGIWIAPFNAQVKSVTAADHPDWLVKDPKSGKPVIGCVAWGGAYVLDFYNPQVREYIKNFFNVILNEWNYDMVKLDFLYSVAMFPRNGKTRGQIMCDAMEFLRECVGEEKLILGCGVPLGPSFGIVDACRIGCDVSPKYRGEFFDPLHINHETPSAQNSINNAMLRRHLNGRVFCNDPDVFFLRDKNLKFTKTQKLLLAKINNMFGDVLFVSDNAGDFDEETTEYLRVFFKQNKTTVMSAEYVTPEDITIRFAEDGKTKILRINLKSGKSNILNLI